MASEEGLKILLKGEVQDFLSSMDAASKAIGKAASSSDAAGKSFSGMSSAAAKAATAVDAETAAFRRATNAVEALGKQHVSIEQLTSAIDVFKREAGRADSFEILKEYNKDISLLEKEVKRLQSVGKLSFQVDKSNQFSILTKDIQTSQAALKSFVADAKATNYQFATLAKGPKAATAALTSFQRSAKGGTTALIGFGRIVQDAPYGIIGIGNNITQFAEQFQYLRQSTGSAGSALKAIGSSLLGAGGLTLGISLLITGITALTQKYGSLGNAIKTLTGELTEQEKSQQAIAGVLKGTENEYVRAVQNVNSLRNEIQLAKDGFLDKEEVVKHYNDTIGKTTGEVKTLEAAEKSLQKNADAYIKFTLLKAAANVALQEAAKKSFEAERERQKSDEESVSYILSGLKNSQDTSVLGIYAKNADKNRQKAAAEFDKDANLLEGIAKKFQDQAAAIAKSFNFDFLDNKDGKGDGKNIKTVTSILAELDKQLTAINTKFAATGGSAQEIGKELQNAYEKALEALSKLGVQTDSPIFNNIKKEVERIQSFVNAPGLNLGQQNISVPIVIDPLPSINTTGLKGLEDKFQPILDELNKQFKSISEKALEGLTFDLADAFGTALASGDFGSIARTFATSIGNFMQELGQALIAVGIGLEGFKNAIKSLNGPLAIIAGVGLVAAGAAFKAIANKGVPSFATGGVVSGPTLAMVGDNPSGIEYMIPKEVLDQLGGGTPSFVIENRIERSEFVTLVRGGERENRRFS